MSTLESLSKEIEMTKRIANIKVEELPSATQGGWGTRIRQAQDKLQELNAKFQEVMLQNGVAIFLYGQPQKVKDFIDLAHAEGDALAVDACLLYERLAEDVELTMSTSRVWGIAQTHRLQLSLHKVMEEVDLTELPMPARAPENVMATHDDVMVSVRDVIRRSSGDMLNRLYCVKQAMVDAAKTGFTGAVVPVLAVGAQSNEREGLSSAFVKGSAVVEIDDKDEVNRDFLIKTFKEVNRKIRSQKK